MIIITTKIIIRRIITKIKIKIIILPNSMIKTIKTTTITTKTLILSISPNSIIVPLTDPSINLCWKKGSKARPKEPNIGI